MPSRLAKTLLIALVGAGTGALPTMAAAAARPVTRTGRQVQLVARDVATPTAFAFSRRVVFMSDGTSYQKAPGIGGVYVLARGIAVRLHSSPVSYGLAWHGHTLYVSAGQRILAWSGWNRGRFTRRRTIYTAPAGFPGFTGLAFGPNGRLYAGVSVGATNDHGPASAPYQYDILSLTPTGADVHVVAQGIRQPWQLAFPQYSSSPLVTDLGQDSGAQRPPDLLLRIRHGQDYGFPTCDWGPASPCGRFNVPWRRLAPHSDPMGLAIVGHRIYISEFGGSTPARVISIPLRGGSERVELSGFGPRRHIVGLGAHRGWIYVGETLAGRKHLGAIWRFRPQ